MTDAPDLGRLAAETHWLRALARSLVRDPHLAEDLAQDTLVAALVVAREQGGPVSSWRAFFATTLRRRLFERRREGAARAERERRSARHEALPSTLAMVARASLQRDLVQSVLELEEPYRTTILWRFFEELPPRAIARRAGVPVATVHTRIQRGLARLRARLERTHGGDGAWVLALAPLARVSLTPAPSGAAPFMKAALMQTSTKTVLAAAVLVGAALVTWKLSEQVPRVAERPALAAVEDTRDEALTLAPPALRASDMTAERVDVPRPAASPAIEAPVPSATPPRALDGLVLDALGRALAGVALRTEPGGETLTSGAGGRFHAALAAPADAVVSADERYATVLAGAARTTAESGAVVVVAPRLALAGRIVDESGTLLAGAELRVQVPANLGTDFGLPLDGALARRWSAVSAVDGAFTLHDVPAVDGARLVVALGGFEARDDPLPLVSATDLELVLRRHGATPDLVRGVVLLPDGGEAARARVGFGIATTVSDAQGRFELAAGRGPTPERVLAVLPGFLAAEARREDFGGAWPDELTLRLGRAPGTIRGKVLAHDGVPVPHARVWLADPTWFGGVEGDVVGAEALAARDDKRFWAFVESEGDGSFVLDGLLARSYTLKALDPRTLLIVESAPIPAGTQDVLLELPTHALFAHVSGRVVASDGAGIPDVAVVVERPTLTYDYPGGGTRDECFPRAAVTTDAEGRFELDDVPREGVELFATGDAILFASLAVTPTLDAERAEIHAERRVHLQVELDPPFERADTLRALDASGHGVILRIMRGSTSETNSFARIEDGRSQVLSLSESARWVVLFKHDVEVARLPFRAEAAGVTTVRW